MYVCLFYTSGVDCGLNSFPTRRSSDLELEVLDDGQQRERLGELERAHHPRARHLVRGHLREVTAVELPRAAVRPIGDGDRKSTRLNPSHVRTSYADFCLIKRTPQNAPV